MGIILLARSVTSTATGEASVTFEQAVMNGLAPDGGLYVPQEVRLQLAN
jgi:threonine synthase